MKKLIFFVFITALILSGCEKLSSRERFKDNSTNVVFNQKNSVNTDKTAPSIEEYQKMIKDILEKDITLENKEKNILSVIVPGDLRSFHMSLFTAVHQYRLKGDFNKLALIRGENEWIASSIDMLKK